MQTLDIHFKPSGIQWLGQIPKHWEVVRLKYVAILYTGDSIKDNDKYKYCIVNNSVPYVSTKDIDIYSNFIDYNNEMFISHYDTNFKRAYKDSILLCIEGANAGKKIAFLNQEVCFVNKLCCINNKSKTLHSKLLFYFLQSIFFKNTFFSNIKGLIGGVTAEHIGNFYIFKPPLKEQKAIASYLDTKCEKIAEFISKKEHTITLLKELKDSIINKAVTQGLDENTAFKDSGIQWLGQIPKHWEVRRIASIGSFSKGGNISRQDLIYNGNPAILYGDIYTKYEFKSYDLESKISKETSLLATPIYKGDILFAGSGETKEDIGKSIVYLGDEKAFAGGDVIIFRQQKHDSLFLSYTLNAKYAKFYKYIESKGEIIVHIYASNLRELRIPIPPLEEQKQIAKYLDDKVAKIDLAITKANEQIKLIQEYKTSLINECVCGRIDLNKEEQ